MKIKKSGEDIFVDSIVYLVLFLVFVTTVYPFYYAVIISFNQGMDALRGGIYLWPRVFTFENYKAVFTNGDLLNGFIISVSRTLIGTTTNLLVTSIIAYTLSHSQLVFRKAYMIFLIIPMFVSGGLIPYFVLLRSLHLMNSFLVYVVPGLFGMVNVFIMMTFFKELPSSFEESAKVDGANDFIILFRIIWPLSTPVLATIALFTGVGHWNSWMDAAYFVTDMKLKTLSYWLIDLINKSNMKFAGGDKANAGQVLHEYLNTYTPQTMRMAVMIVVVLPILSVYPFLQKYFVKGIMIGGIKS